MDGEPLVAVLAANVSLCAAAFEAMALYRFVGSLALYRLYVLP